MILSLSHQNPQISLTALIQSDHEQAHVKGDLADRDGGSNTNVEDVMNPKNYLPWYRIEILKIKYMRLHIK
jgi:hypothetical protein